MRTSLIDSAGLGSSYQVFEVDTEDFVKEGTGTLTLVLDTLKPGDVVLTSGIRVVRLNALAHAAATVTVNLETSADADRFIAPTDMKTANNRSLVPTTAAQILPYRNSTGGNINLHTDIVVASGAVSTLTGRLAFFVPIIRHAEVVRLG